MRTLLAIPVYNEERYLRRVLSEVRKYIDDILVVDDGSTDRTPDILAEQPDIAVIRHEQNQGYGQSLIDAFAYAARRGYDWIVTMDCDEQHEPCRIPDFVAAAAAGDADVISGSRYTRGTPADDLPPPDRRRINAQITHLINEVLELPITDAFCGYKAYRRPHETRHPTRRDRLRLPYTLLGAGCTGEAAYTGDLGAIDL